MPDPKVRHSMPAETAAALSFHGHPIHARRDGEVVNITDMWKAAGSPKDKRPVDWLRSAEAEGMKKSLKTLMVGNSHDCLVETRKGNPAFGGGATWAHWQLAMAYAQSLSAEFHIWCNDVVRGYMQGRPPASTGRADWDRILAAVLLAEDEPLEEYEAMMPASLVGKLVALDKQKWNGGRHPRYLRSTNKALWNRVLSREVGALLTERTPQPCKGNSYAMRLTAAGQEVWRRALITIENCATDAESKEHFWNLIDRHFGAGLLQIRFPFARLAAKSDDRPSPGAA